MLQSGIEPGFLPKIPGERDDLDGAALVSVELFQIMKRGVPAAIVDKDNFIVITAALESGDHSILKGSDIFCFVVTGNDQG